MIRKLAPVEEVYVVFATKGQPAISTTTVDAAGVSDLRCLNALDRKLYWTEETHVLSTAVATPPPIPPPKQKAIRTKTMVVTRPNTLLVCVFGWYGSASS